MIISVPKLFPPLYKQLFFPSIATNLIKSLKPTWQVTTLDYEPSKEAHKTIKINDKNNLDSEFEQISLEIRNLNNRFDSIFCFSDSEIPQLKISDPSIFTSLKENSYSSISLMLLGNFFQNHDIM